jgi:hypothetical protein
MSGGREPIPASCTAGPLETELREEEPCEGHRRGHPTNVEAVMALMEHGGRAALMQAFVLIAIQKYASQCIEAGPERFDTELMSGAAWVQCARDAAKAVNAHLNPNVNS